MNPFDSLEVKGYQAGNGGKGRTPQEVEDLLGKPERTWEEAWEVALANRGLAGRALRRVIKEGYLTATWDIEDAKQDALEALVHAAKSFDPSYGYKFSTFAVPAVQRKLSNSHQKDLAPTGGGREKSKQKRVADVASLDAMVENVFSGEEDGTYDHVVPESLGFEDYSDYSVDLEAIRREVDNVKALLPEREQYILDQRMAGRSYAEISPDIGITRQRVEQIWRTDIRPLLKEALGGLEER